MQNNSGQNENRAKSAAAQLLQRSFSCSLRLGFFGFATFAILTCLWRATMALLLDLTSLAFAFKTFSTVPPCSFKVWTLPSKRASTTSLRNMRVFSTLVWLVSVVSRVSRSRFHLQIGFLGLVVESPAISTATAYVPYAQLGGRPSLSHDVFFCWPLPSSAYSWASRQISWVCSELNMKHVDKGFCLFQSPARDYVSISWLLDLTLEEGLELEQFKIYFETYRPQLWKLCFDPKRFSSSACCQGFCCSLPVWSCEPRPQRVTKNILKALSADPRIWKNLESWMSKGFEKDSKKKTKRDALCKASFLCDPRLQPVNRVLCRQRAQRGVAAPYLSTMKM